MNANYRNNDKLLTSPASFQPQAGPNLWPVLLCEASQLCIAMYLKYVTM